MFLRRLPLHFQPWLNLKTAQLDNLNATGRKKQDFLIRTIWTQGAYIYAHVLTLIRNALSNMDMSPVFFSKASAPLSAQPNPFMSKTFWRQLFLVRLPENPILGIDVFLEGVLEQLGKFLQESGIN